MRIKLPENHFKPIVEKMKQKSFYFLPIWSKYYTKKTAI